MSRFSHSNLLRSAGLFTLCLAFQANLIGCDSSEGTQPSQGPQSGIEKANNMNGALVFEYQLSGTAKFTIHKQKKGLMMSADAHMDLDEALLPVLESALQERSVAGAYKKIRSVRAEAFEVPQVLLDLDSENGLGTAIASPEKPSQSASPDAEGDDASAAHSGPLAKTGAVEPDWDWNADANWFKKQARKFGPKRSGDWNVEWFESYFTNAQHPWIRRIGYHHFAIGMAASHIATARFQGKEEDCGWFSCSWDNLFDETIQPRHYRYHSWPNGSTDELSREFHMDGNQPSPRVHLGLLWYRDFVAL